jgi:hypothetical protein
MVTQCSKTGGTLQGEVFRTIGSIAIFDTDLAMRLSLAADAELRNRDGQNRAEAVDAVLAILSILIS